MPDAVELISHGTIESVIVALCIAVSALAGAVVYLFRFYQKQLDELHKKNYELGLSSLDAIKTHTAALDRLTDVITATRSTGQQ